MQLTNSTVIRELSTIFFFRQLISGGLYLGGWGYIRVLISGRLVSWGRISEGLIYPGAYIREHISRGLVFGWLITGSLYPGDFYPGNFYPGDFYPGAYIREAYNRGANIRGLITEGFYPGDFYPVGLYSTLTILKDSTCFTLAERAHAFAANK